MRQFVAIASMLAFSSCGALAKDASVKTGPPPAWAQISEPLPVPDDVHGPTFLRRQNVQNHLDKSGQSTFFASLIHLMDVNALQLGNFGLSWNPAAGTPVIHAVKVYRGGTVRDVLANTAFEILRREDQLEQAQLDGMLTAVLRIPDLRVGDDLELSYTIPSQDPTLGSDSNGILFLAYAPPPGRVTLRLSWDKGQEPRIRATPDIEPLITREPQAISINLDNPELVEPPKDAPPRFNRLRLLEFSDFASWQSASSRIAPLYSAAAILPSGSPLRQEAAAIIAANPDQLARAAAALRLVQEQVRYIYVGLNGGNLTPANAEDTWQKRYGDCKGKTTLLLALLKELGVPAQAILVNNSDGDDGLDQLLPSLYLFDHVIVRAQIDGKSYWLDPTLPHYFQPSVDPVLPYRWVLPIADSDASLERIAWKPLDKPGQITLIEIDARAGFAEPAKQHHTMITRGKAALLEYYSNSAVAKTQLEAVWRRQLEGSETWSQVTSVSWRFDPKEQASITEIIGTGPVDWGDTGRSRTLTLPGGGFSPPRRRQRSNEQQQSVPFYIEPEFDCRVTTVRLPSGTAEKDWSFNSTYNRAMFGQTFRRSFKLSGGSISMMRANRTIQTEIEAASAIKDNALVSAFDNSMAEIFYDPGSPVRPWPKESLPATFEIDWVADPSACLEPQTIKK